MSNTLKRFISPVYFLISLFFMVFYIANNLLYKFSPGYDEKSLGMLLWIISLISPFAMAFIKVSSKLPGNKYIIDWDNTHKNCPRWMIKGQKVLLIVTGILIIRELLFPIKDSYFIDIGFFTFLCVATTGFYSMYRTKVP